MAKLPPLELRVGQEILASITSTSGTLSSSASAAKSSMLSDETLTTSGGLNLAYSGTMCSMK